MKIEIIKCLQDNYSYMIIDEKLNVCVVDQVKRSYNKFLKW